MYEGKFVTAIISAGGSGSRMGAGKNKLFLELNHRTILARTIDKIYRSSYVDHIIIVVRKEDRAQVEKLIDAYDRQIFSLAPGGASRQESIYNGLKLLPEDTKLVLSHDGARPFVATDKIDRAIETLEDYDGLVFGVAVKDTIKVVRPRGDIEATPNRKYLYHIQTPQIFHKDIMVKAYEKALIEDIEVTDDSQIVEVFGGRVKLFEGDYSNIKITTVEDLSYGEMLLKREL